MRAQSIHSTMINAVNKFMDFPKETMRPILLGTVSLLWMMYLSGMLELWTMSEEYGHGLMVFGLLIYILYRRRDTMDMNIADSGWLSIPLALLAAFGAIAGVASGITVISMYAVIAFLMAVIFVFGGITLLRKMLVPLLIIWLLVPLPNPYGPMLTSGLQLVSSQLGVWFIRMLGGVVYLEGNVIDMGGVQLLVAEACSGLRYLFPLMSLGAIIGYMLHAPIWLRVTVFVVTIPITIVLNSIRIGLTGLLSEHWGLVHIQGFLHFFEGWVVFIVATLMLLAVLWALLRFSMPRKTIRDVLLFESPKGDYLRMYSSPSSFSKPRLSLLWALVIVMAATAIVTTMLAVRTEKTPERDSLNHFPVTVGEWIAHEYRLPQETEGVAGASEYYIGDFTARDNGSVNLYVSFYETQLHGQIPHSPKVCIPGGGWQIESMRKIVLHDRRGQPFEANRLVIAKGGHRQLTYYWLKQGERMYSQEWRARLDLIRISLFENRTDGALVRVVTEIDPQGVESEADRRLQKFSGALISVLSGYIPD